LKISILGSGPIPNKLAQAIQFDSPVKLFTSQDISIENVDVLNYETFINKKIDFDVVVIAWRGIPSKESEKGKVLEHLVRNIPNTGLILNLSSVAVYGSNPEISSEITIPRPINTYGHSKYDLELYLNTFAESKVCNLRISNVFGDPSFTDVLNSILDGAVKAKSINLVSPSVVSRDFISMVTLIEILKHIISVSNNLPRREVINISSGVSITLSALLNFVEDLRGSKLLHHELPLSDDLIEQSLVSNKKMTSFLNYDIDSQSIEMQRYIRARLDFEAKQS
jgi:hypothetical protein